MTEDFHSKAKKRVQARKQRAARRDETPSKIAVVKADDVRTLKTQSDSKFTEDAVEVILHGISMGADQTTCAKAAGINPSTLRRWKMKGLEGKQPYATFVEEMEKREALFEIDCLEEIRMNGGWRGRAWILERRNPKKWSSKVEHQHQHDHQHRHKITGFIPDNNREPKKIEDAQFEVIDD